MSAEESIKPDSLIEGPFWPERIKVISIPKLKE
jgi:hypothetical protein